LPWRGDRDPYRIWISEVMLQQTQVATVVPYYHRFLGRFPTLASLAEADEHDVLRIWEGLGYYRRARALSRTARILREKNHDTIPDNPDLVGSLPGFGRYTVGAVLSQAYDRRLPILEANSRRVLCRLAGIDGLQQDALLWQLAESLLPKKKVGDLNQSLMELGALVCTPTQPKCHVCPVHGQCLARKHNRQQAIPARAASAKVERVEEVAIILQKRDRVLLVQRPDDGRWPGMWEFPHCPLEWMESHADAAERLLRDMRLSGRWSGSIATIRHTVTRFRITMVGVHGTYQRGNLRKAIFPQAKWVRIPDLLNYPLAAPQRILARHLERLSPTIPR
jgi:A/G-specific adenine glycosylase